MDTKFYTSPTFYGPHYYPQQVKARVPCFCISPGYGYGQPIPDYKWVDGKLVNVGQKHYSTLTCGHSHEDAAIGETVHCEECVHQARGVFLLKAALAAGVVSHTRAQANGRDQLTGRLAVYRREPTSPTGVYSVCGVEETDEVRALLKGGLSPLSPTEGR